VQIINTGRLVLRTWRDEDEIAFRKHLNTDEVMQWISKDGKALTDRSLKKDIEFFRNCQDEHGHTFWIIEQPEDASFVGICGLIPCTKVDGRKGKPEIGFRLRRDCEGEGYAREAGAASLNYAFGKLDSDCVVAQVDPRNERSLRVLKRLGFLRVESLEQERYTAVFEVKQSCWPRAAC